MERPALVSTHACVSGNLNAREFVFDRMGGLLSALAERYDENLDLRRSVGAGLGSVSSRSTRLCRCRRKPSPSGSALGADRCYTGGVGTWDELFDLLAACAIEAAAAVYHCNWEKNDAPLLLKFEVTSGMGWVHSHALTPVRVFESAEVLTKTRCAMATDIETIALTATDPFAAERDTAEERAARIFQEAAIAAKSPELVFRQDTETAGYVLVVPQLQGERTVTVPAAQEADFLPHGRAGTTAAELASFVLDTVEQARADVVRIPLLTRRQAERLEEELAARLPAWHWGRGLTSVSPMVDRRLGGWRRRNSLWRAHERAHEQGLRLEQEARIPIDEVMRLHHERWGANRAPSFFAMLQDLVEANSAEALTVRTINGELVAFQTDVVGRWTRHIYYGVTDFEKVPSVGKILDGWSWTNFMEDPNQVRLSFGRGSERYKFQYANFVEEHHEVRGFFSALGPQVRLRGQ